MKIVVVIVTYNRLKCLKKALECYSNQTKQPDYIIVVNNHSTDGTDMYLAEWEKESKSNYVVSLNTNTGGSGGFYAGLENAMKLDADWIWLSDDDAYPEVTALEELQHGYDELKKSNHNIVGLCTSVVNQGKIDIFHRRRLVVKWNKINTDLVAESEYEKNAFKLNDFSYVGCLISKKVLEKVGLTERDYFIYFDDTEHSYRISRQGEIFCIPKAIVHHDTGSRQQSNILFDWKLYYMYRNRALFFRKHFKWTSYGIEEIIFSLRYLYKKIRKRSGPDEKVHYEAIQDAKKELKGLKECYMPGWKLTIEEWEKHREEWL